MANIKKGQIANIIFPMVDSTDFASIESGITASDFNSAATRQYIGYNHGASATAAFSNLSKTTNLVTSGIFHHVLNETETNFDVVMVRFIHPSCADQLLVYHTVTYDDSDIYSQLSDIGSNLLSYLTGMSGMLSDVDSQLLLNASMISDVQSALDSQYLVQLSDLSDIKSQVDVINSVVAALDYALDSQFVWTSDYLSDMHSDLRSQIENISVVASITPSDISDIASAVWANVIGARVDSRILLIQSNVSDVESQLDLTASVVSDIQSALDSQFLVVLSNLSDVESQVDLLATSNYLSQIHSDLYSAIGNVSVALTASDISDIASAVADAVTVITPSDISDIASAVWANTIGARVDSRILLIQSNVSDVESQLDLTASVVSDIQSALDSQFLVVLSNLSDVESQIDLNTSTLSDIYSLLSDVESQLDLTASVVSDIQSALDSQFLVITSNISDVDSQLLLNASMISDIQSALDSQFLIITSNLSDVESQIDLNTSTLSDIYSLISDIESQLDLTASVVSDVQSAIDSQFVWTSAFLSDMNSDLSSQIGGITASLSLSDISDIASAVWADTIGARVDSRILVLQSNLSDVESQVDLLATSNYLSQIHSDLYSAIGNVSVALTASDISDIASAIAAAGLTITASDMSDIASRVWAEPVRTLTPTTAGAIAFTYTVTSSGTGNPIEGVEVWITTDVAGTNVVWNGHTDAFGVARDSSNILPYLDAGTYYFWSQKAGYTFTNPDTEVVS